MSSTPPVQESPSMTSGMTPTLYLTVEDAARELDAKILIASAAVRAGLSVVIGQQWLLVNNHGFIPKGLMLFKGMNARLANATRVVIDSGHLTAALDEEVLGLSDTPYIQRYIDPDLANHCHMFLAQGERHADAIAGKIKVDADMIRTVGNPRIDLLRPPFLALHQEEADSLRKEHGDYILLNTNAGRANSAFGSVEQFRDVVIRVGWMKPDDPDDEALFRSAVDFDMVNLKLIHDFVAKASAAFPNTRIIIRPHGAERRETWEKFGARFPNVRVIRDGRHASWMLGSRAVIHTCCTTGLEAEVLGRAAINIRPANFDTSLHHVFISNTANVGVSDGDEAVAMLARVLAGDTSSIDHAHDQRMAALAEHIDGIEGVFSYEKIAAAAVELLSSHGATTGDFHWQPTDPENYLGAVRRTDYQREKINLSQTEFEEKWRELTALTGEPVDTAIKQIGDSLFLVEAI
jgi:surface carbohydrate biosynthesis protein